MRYSNVVPGRFLDRPNRFIAHIEIDGETESCHVKNTGRCRELLTAGTQVWCQRSENPKRKTKYDLICVQKGNMLINMDSQAPNIAVMEWLQNGGMGSISDLRAETTHGDSRFDFSFVKDGIPCFLEVKGVTLESEGICAFPDAPTQRGIKHIRGLIEAVHAGFGSYLLFVVQMERAIYLRPNYETDPAFGLALREAAENGVQILAMDCAVTPDSMTLRAPVEVRLDG